MERRLFNSHSKVLSSICARRRWPLMSLTVNVRIPSRYSIYSKDIIHYLKWFCWDDATPKINCQFYLISPTTDQRNCYFYPESWNIQIVQLIKTIVPYNNCPIVYRTRWSLCWAQNTENSRTIKFSIAALDKWQMCNCYWILVYSFKKRIQNETVFSSPAEVSSSSFRVACELCSSAFHIPAVAGPLLVVLATFTGFLSNEATKI